MSEKKEKKLNLMQKLFKIQAELKAPKGQFNKFGGFKFRNCEDILEAVKPLLSKYELYLNISDSISMVGERYYVKATASVMDEEGQKIEAIAYAREQDFKKGMDEAQLTGACSSYARKYSLNGLFAIDDTKDQDSMDNKSTEKSKSKALTVAEMQKKILDEIMAACANGQDADTLADILSTLGVRGSEEIRNEKNLKTLSGWLEHLK